MWRWSSVVSVVACFLWSLSCGGNANDTTGAASPSGDGSAAASDGGASSGGRASGAGGGSSNAPDAGQVHGP